jgi:hypothetical protein
VLVPGPVRREQQFDDPLRLAAIGGAARVEVPAQRAGREQCVARS